MGCKGKIGVGVPNAPDLLNFFVWILDTLLRAPPAGERALEFVAGFTLFISFIFPDLLSHSGILDLEPFPGWKYILPLLSGPTSHETLAFFVGLEINQLYSQTLNFYLLVTYRCLAWIYPSNQVTSWSLSR